MVCSFRRPRRARTKRLCARRRQSRPRREVVSEIMFCQNVVTFSKSREKESRIIFNLGYQKKKRDILLSHLCFPVSESAQRRRRNNHTHTHDTCLPPPPTSSSRRRPTRRRVSSRRREDTTSPRLRDDHNLLCAHHRQNRRKNNRKRTTVKLSMMSIAATF